MDAFELTADEATRAALAEEVARRLRRGESRTSVRDSLLAAGLSPAFVDGILARFAEPVRWSVASVAAAALSVTAAAVLIATLVVLPVAGAVCGAWVAWSPLADQECGMWVFPALFQAACGGLLGLAAGVGLALAIARGCMEFSDRMTPDD